MAENIPPKLYKYQPYNPQTLDNLKNRKIWFSKPAGFNDPFDGSLGFKIEEITDNEWQSLAETFIKESSSGSNEYGRSEFEKIHLTDGKPNQVFRQKVLLAANHASTNMINKNQEHGVACFSEKVDDILMWAHYADGHRGFCLEFDTKFAPFEKANKVVYSNDYPVLNIADLVIKQKRDSFPSVLITKSEHWSYEQEWRVLHEEGNKEYGINVEGLTGVYFGCAMPFVHLEIIALILRDSPTKLYEMQRSGIEFTVKPDLIEYTPFDYSHKIS